MVKRRTLTKLLFYVGLMCFLSVFSYLPPVSAEFFTSQCTFENDQGQKVPCTQREFGGQWPYAVSDEGTYYNITRKGEWLALPIHPAIEYDWKPNKISWKVTVSAKNQFSSMSTSYNQTHRVATVSMQGSPSLLEFLWDNQYSILQTLPEGNVTDVQESSFFTLEGNEIKFYFEKGWAASVDYPVIISFNSYVISQSDYWDGGTFTNTNLDENQSVTLDIDTSIYDEALLFVDMDTFNGTHVFNNNASSSDCSIENGAADAIGFRNRSRDFDGSSQYLACPDANNEYDTNEISFAVKAVMRNYSAGTGNNYLMERFGSGVNSWYLEIRSLVRPQAAIRTNNGWVTMLGVAGDLPDEGEWFCYGVSYNGTDAVQLFADAKGGGREIDHEFHTGTVNANTIDINIGRQGNAANNYWNGTIDEAMIWSRGISNAEFFRYCNESYLSSGNFSSAERDSGAGNLLINVSYEGLIDGASTVNLWVNGSNDNWATAGTILSVQQSASPSTNYSVDTGFRYYRIITELVNGSTPHISSITGEEGPDTLNPNVTSMEPINNSDWEQFGQDIQIIFNSTNTDNVLVQNCTLFIWSGGVLLDYRRMDVPVEIFDVVGTVTSGSISDIISDNNVYRTQAEDGTAPECMNSTFNFTGLDLAHNFQIISDGRYNPGGVAHTIEWFWLNYSSGLEVNFRNESRSSTDIRFESSTILASEMVDSNGNATVGYRHIGATCGVGHRYNLDLLELSEIGHDTVNATAGFCEIDVALNVSQSPIDYIWQACDSSNNCVNFSLGNYTITITASPPSAPVVIQPFNITYTAIEAIPVRVSDIDLELDVWLYELNGGTNVTFSPNTTLHSQPNGLYTIRICHNLTNGLFNCTTVVYNIDYDGLYWEYAATAGGTGMQTELYIFYLSAAFLVGLYALNRKDPITMFVSSLFFALCAVQGTAITTLSAGTEFTYVYGNYILLWYGFSLVGIILTFLFAMENPEFDPGSTNIGKMG